ncbi:MAG: alanyl-tRNA editing protein [Deltaproteobacteria bacterium]|nr:alanyl-tRNA editing protein [Deltaproteobacteria bacterium]
MTKKIFWDDPYLTQLETYVTGVKGDEITLEQTIFFAFSGGQESDTGTIGNCRVLQARTEGKEIIYTLEQGHGLKKGDPVSIKIDWERRYQLMRLHFAAEIVLELMCRNFKSIKKVGAHIAADKARIDFEWGGNISNILPAIQKEALRIIGSNSEIISAFSNEETEERYWEIVGFARIPCGGTHLKRTGEIGEIELKRKNPGKGKERVEIYLMDNPTKGKL